MPPGPAYAQIIITPSPVVDYIALGATGVIVVLGLLAAWLVDRWERRRAQPPAHEQDAGPPARV